MAFSQNFIEDIITIIWAHSKQGMFHQVLHYSFSFQKLITIPQGKLISANYIYMQIYLTIISIVFFQIAETNSGNTGLRENSSHQRIIAQPKVPYSICG